MVRKTLIGFCLVFVILVVYFIAMPVPVEPLAWKAPPNPGYQGVFAVNRRLKGLEMFPLGDAYGPEDTAIDNRGRIYAATENGKIMRLQSDGSGIEEWANTGGRPLGLEFSKSGDLIVADANKGLLSVDPEGKVTSLATEADGLPIWFPDDLDIAADGKVYFSDASKKFIAQNYGGTYEASLHDLLEHGKYGRLLMYDPETGQATILLDGLSFANGVAVSHDQTSVLVVETGEYRIIRHWLIGPKKGQSEQFGPIFPSFPDNISRGLNGRYWLALASPRYRLLDMLSESPFLRKMLWRIPAFWRPKAQPYGHIVALNENGEVVENLQDSDAGYPMITSVTETADYLYLGSLFTTVLGRLAKDQADLK